MRAPLWLVAKLVVLAYCAGAGYYVFGAFMAAWLAFDVAALAWEERQRAQRAREALMHRGDEVRRG